jgi:hypothetical protein
MKLKPVTVMAVLLLVVASLSVSGCTDPRADPLAGKKQAIVNDVLPLVNKSIPSRDNITVVGQCLIWNEAQAKQSDAQDKLPSELKMNDASSKVTVFLITAIRDERIGQYSESGAYAYSSVADITVFYWPDKVVVGTQHIYASNVPGERVVQEKAEHSDPSENIAKWITTLKRAETVALSSAQSGPEVYVTATAVSVPSGLTPNSTEVVVPDGPRELTDALNNRMGRGDASARDMYFGVQFVVYNVTITNNNQTLFGSEIDVLSDNFTLLDSNGLKWKVDPMATAKFGGLSTYWAGTRNSRDDNPVIGDIIFKIAKNATPKSLTFRYNYGNVTVNL